MMTYLAKWLGLQHETVFVLGGHQDIFFYLFKLNFSMVTSQECNNANRARIESSFFADHCRGRNANFCSASNYWDRGEWLGVLGAVEVRSGEMKQRIWWWILLWIVSSSRPKLLSWAVERRLFCDVICSGGCPIPDSVVGAESLFIRFITCTCLDWSKDSEILLPVLFWQSITW